MVLSNEGFRSPTSLVILRVDFDGEEEVRNLGYGKEQREIWSPHDKELKTIRKPISLLVIPLHGASLDRQADRQRAAS